MVRKVYDNTAEWLRATIAEAIEAAYTQGYLDGATDEREACAVVCNARQHDARRELATADDPEMYHYWKAGRDIWADAAAAIRARGESVPMSDNRGCQS
jgi:hypothetical protein